MNTKTDDQYKEEIFNQLRALQTTYDTRYLAPMMLVFAGDLLNYLMRNGFISKTDLIDSMFEVSRQALTEGKPVQVHIQSDVRN